jgi:drug/metabolite transporter (DMT)-like permease
MIDWKSKLTSRKFWLAVTDFVGMMLVFFGYAENTVTQVTALIMGGAGLVAYVIAEGFADGQAAGAPVALPYIEDEEE